MSLEGLKLAALYSYGCRTAKRLGINQLLSEFIEKEEKPDKIREILKKLISYKWYQLIASGNRINDPFKKKVVESYWTGNEITSIVFFHNFTVLEGFHSKLDNLESVEECKISLGRVLDFEKHHRGESIIRVSYHALIRSDKEERFFLTLVDKSIDAGFVEKASKGDFVTFHYNVAREILDEKRAKLFNKLTKETVVLFNE